MATLDPSAPWHSQSIEKVVSELETEIAQGLTAENAAKRLERVGPNELHEKPSVPFWKLVLAQLNSFVVILLIVASIISALLGDYVEAAAIMAIVVLNAVLGVVQESRAEAALAALKKMAAPEAEVIRDGHRQKISSRELVPGDVVLLEAGNFVPADLRLVESINLKIDEASLTGESNAVEKRASDTLAHDAPIADRHNAAYMSSMVTYGRGKGIVTSTGMDTQIGLIAQMIQSFKEEPTPLQRKLDQLGKTCRFDDFVRHDLGSADRDHGQVPRRQPTHNIFERHGGIQDRITKAECIVIAQSQLGRHRGLAKIGIDQKDT